MTPVERLLEKLLDAKQVGKHWKARCPAHDDHNPSLSITEGDDGRVLLHCHSGCPTQKIVAAMGLKMRDLMPAHTSDSDKNPRHRPQSVFLSVSDSSESRKTYATPREAIAALERRHGKRSARWTYTDAHGDPVGVIVRWDTSTGKDIRPVSRMKSGWVIGGMPTPRLLYRLPDLTGANHVYVVEGEKAADAMRSVGLIATTSPHGSKSAAKADWSPLAGKDVVILPDADDAGQHYCDDVIACLSKLSPAPTVKVVDLPGLPAGGDAADFIALPCNGGQQR